MPFAIAAGGGLAGTAFALEIVRGGGRAMIIEKSAGPHHNGPHHKVCGEFLSEIAALLLRHLGVNCDLLGCSTIAKLRLDDGTSYAMAPLPFHARGLSRLRLDEVLITAATAAGVEVLRATAVEGSLRMRTAAAAFKRPEAFSRRRSCSGEREAQRARSLSPGRPAGRIQNPCDTFRGRPA